MSDPIFLSGREAASYIWNTDQGNAIVKGVKSAIAFVKGVFDRFSVSEAQGREYIDRTDTENTYARAILERQIRVIDTINKKVPVYKASPVAPDGLDKAENKSEPSKKSEASSPKSGMFSHSAAGVTASPVASYSQSPTTSRVGSRLESTGVAGHSSGHSWPTASSGYHFTYGSRTSAPDYTFSPQSTLGKTDETFRPTAGGVKSTTFRAEATSLPTAGGVKSTTFRDGTTSRPNVGGVKSTTFRDGATSRPSADEVQSTTAVAGSATSSVDGEVVEQIGMDVGEILPFLQIFKMDNTKVIAWFEKVKDLGDKVKDGRVSKEAALQMAPELAGEFISFLPIREHLKTGLQSVVQELIAMESDGKEFDKKSVLEILRKNGQLFYEVSKDLLDTASSSLEMDRSEYEMSRNMLAFVANIIQVAIKPENENKSDDELLPELMPLVAEFFATLPEEAQGAAFAQFAAFMDCAAAGASPQEAVPALHPGLMAFGSAPLMPQVV